MLINEITTGDKISFDLYASVGGRTSVTGTVYGSMMGQMVPSINEIRANHTSVYPLLPQAIKESTPEDYRLYEYLAIMTPSEELIYIGKPWIVEATLTEIELKELKITATGWDATKLTAEDIKVFFASYGVTIKSIIQE